VPASRVGRFMRGLDAFRRVLPHGLEQVVARRAIALAHDDERAVHEPREHVEHVARR
jgi:hypothetical protein